MSPPAPPAAADKTITLDGKRQSALASQRPKTHEMERDRIGLWGCGDDGQSTSRISGLDRLKHPGLNKVPYY